MLKFETPPGVVLLVKGSLINLQITLYEDGLGSIIGDYSFVVKKKKSFKDFPNVFLCWTFNPTSGFSIYWSEGHDFDNFKFSHYIEAIE